MSEKKRVLITGGCGFIGHHVVEHIIKNTDWEVIVLDKLSYASSGFGRLRDIGVFDDRRVTVFAADFTNPLPKGLKEEIGELNYILHLGAETHVDNSIRDPGPFIIANVVGTMRMLDFARTLASLEKFVYFSTDEVFGPAPEGVAYKEWDRYNSTNPYSASKAGGEELALAYANTYKLPVIITHTMNVFGERQHPEKFVPMTIRKILNGEKILIHSDPTKTKAGSRFWIHAKNVASALLFLLEKGQNRDKYNIVGEREVDNLQMAQFIARVLGKELHYEMIDFHSSRPGQDLRYALDGTKLAGMGYGFPRTFDESLTNTVKWYFKEGANNVKWLDLRGKDYDEE
ncbi:MAG: GDP-mannose 4,6-dehydratase [Candidatus Nanoarchaeia archaeon]|nr:GDP-mannose 4,6-dehydratase [Candidatus Nanoarchaeia archaeon]